MNHRFVPTVLRWITAFFLLGGALAEADDWQVNTNDRLQVRAAKAVERIRQRLPLTARYFDDAYGFVVWPGIVRVGVGFGGAHGKGILVEGDTAVGTAGYWQFSSGIQAGAKSFSMIIFFQDAQALDYFRRGDFHFMGQVGVDVATVGAHGTPGYESGAAVFVLTSLGLMGEFSYSGVKFNYRPFKPSRILRRSDATAAGDR